MTKIKYLILGAGPSGLAFANKMKENGENSFLVLEQEDEAGGLCRSKTVDGSPLDIGGGHFLDVRRKNVNEFLFQFMPEKEWNIFERDSRIVLDNECISHPFEANIWQMPEEKQVEYLKSIAVAGCNLNESMPNHFIQWIEWKLGKKIAEDYMLPYNSKMFGDNLNQLGTYWLEKLPNVSFEETLLSCLRRKAYGEQPGHASFYYPKKFGYGELWKRMAQAIEKHIEYNKKVVSLNVREKKVVCSDGSKYYADNIITTIPWKSYDAIEGVDAKKLLLIQELKHTGVEIVYVPDNLDTKAHWLYMPQKELSYHRILVRHNFCNNSKGYWTETNMERIDSKRTGFSFINEYAYPLNTISKPEIMKDLLCCMSEYRIFGLGRWGEHEHYNSDTTVEKAMALADTLVR